MKPLRVAFCIFALTLAAFAQGGALSGQALKCNSSMIASGATIRVCSATATGTPCSPLASVYSDSTLVTPLTNPTTADSCGNFPEMYAAQGNYKVQISGTGLTTYTYFVNVSANAHNLLSSTHSDTTSATLARGDGLFVVGAGLTWQHVAHGATTGSYFKWNGTDIVASTNAAAGTGSCTNQVETADNADAAPTCTTVNTSYVSAGLITGMRSITIFDPVAGDSGRVQIELPKNVTITRVQCSVKAATNVVIQLNKRAEATPDVSGTDVLTSSLTCITTGANTTSFASAAWTSRTPLALTISSVSGTPDTLRVQIEYTVDAAQ